MSQWYKYNIDVHGVTKASPGQVIVAVPFPADGTDYDPATKTVRIWGENALPAEEPRVYHRQVKEALKKAKIKHSRVATRWRCTENDDWDEEFER